MRQQGINWSSLIGWLIFILVIGGGPIQSVIQSIFGVALPGYFIPALIGGLIVLSIIASLFGRFSESIRTTGETSAAPSTHRDRPMQRGDMPGPAMPGAMLSPEQLQRAYDRNPAMKPPAFEPVIHPLLATVGVVGLVVLGAIGVLVWAVGP